MISVVLVDWLTVGRLRRVCFVCEFFKKRENSVILTFIEKKLSESVLKLLPPQENFWCLIWWVLSLCARIENGVSRNRKIARQSFWWNQIDKWTHPNVINGDGDCFSSSDNVICFAQLAFFAQFIYVRKKSFRWIHQATNCVCSERSTTTKQKKKQIINLDLLDLIWIRRRWRQYY